MHVEPAHGVLAAETRGDKMAGTYFDQIAFLRQSFQCGVDFIASSAARSKLTHQLFERGAGTGQVGYVVEDCGVGHQPQL